MMNRNALEALIRGVAQRVADHSGLAGERNIADDGAASLEKASGHRLDVEVAGCSHDEIALLVEQHNRAALGPGHVDQAVDDPVQDLIEDQRRVDDFSDLAQAGQTAAQVARLHVSHGTYVMSRTVGGSAILPLAGSARP